MNGIYKDWNRDDVGNEIIIADFLDKNTILIIRCFVIFISI